MSSGDELARREAAPDPHEIAIGLRNYYAGVVEEPLDPRMTELLARLSGRGGAPMPAQPRTILDQAVAR
jgi:hypothetical protein